MQARKFETRLSGGTTKIALAFVTAMLLALLVPATALATTIFVTTTADIVDGDTSSLVALDASPGSDGAVSLREAVLALDGETLPAQIMLDGATFELRGDTTLVSSGGHAPVFGGPLVIPKSVHIVGSGATIMPATPVTGNARLLDIDPTFVGGVSFQLSDAILANGVGSDGWGGGALIAGGAPAKDSVTLTGCTLMGNSAKSSFPVSGGALNIGENVDLTLTNCMFANNVAYGAGGAIFISDSGAGSVAISGCTFGSNASQGSSDSAGQGGAIYATVGTGGGTITGSTFTSNGALSDGSHGPDSGGALFLGTNGAFTMSGNRIAGNSADQYPGLFGSLGTINAQSNWWGRNAAPTNAPALVGGTGIDSSQPMQLTLTPTSSLVHVGDSSLLVAGVANGAVKAPDDGAGVSFDGGSLGWMDTAVVALTDGEAADTFYAGSDCGPNVVSATYDSQTVTAAVGVTREPELSGLDSAEFTVGSYGQADITSYGYLLPSFSLVGALPSGLGFGAADPIDATHAVGRFLGTPDPGTGGVYNVRVSSSNAIAPDATHDVVITVNEAPEITSSGFAEITDGQPCTITVSASGYPAPVLSANGLPTGLSLTDNGDGTAVITGTPSGMGEYSVDISADNSVDSAHQTFTFVVNHAPTNLSVDSAHTFVIGEYDWTGLYAEGYPAPGFSADGLPAGLAVDVSMYDTFSNGEIAGTPEPGTAGEYDAVVHSGNGVGVEATGTIHITVVQLPEITSSASVEATTGEPFSFKVETSGYPTATLACGDTLPDGLTFTDNGDGTGTISGTPDGMGDYTLTLSADNGYGSSASQDLTIHVLHEPTGWSALDATFMVGAYATRSFTVQGTPLPVLSYTGTLPSGLSFLDLGGDPDGPQGNGEISGTGVPGTGGQYPIVLHAANGIGGDSSLAVTVTVLEAPSINADAETTVTAGAAASIEVTSSGYPTATISAEGTLPAGLAFADSGDGTGTFSGTLGRKTGGDYPVTLHASNGVGGDVTRAITLHVVRTPAAWESRTYTWDTQADFEHNAGTTGATTTIAGEANTTRIPGSVTLRHIMAVAAGHYHTVGLKSDGTVVATGYDGSGQCNVSGWTGITAVAAGLYHTVGLKSDGTVVAIGGNGSGQCNVSGWTGITAVAAGADHTVGLKSDGTVVATGNNTDGQCNVSSWTGITAVAAGFGHTVGLKSDGTVVATGYNTDGECNVSGWTGITALAAGAYHTVGLKPDGTMVATGDNSYGQCNVSSWTGITTVAAGAAHTLGLKSDGTVVATGWNGLGACNVSGWTGITAISAGFYHTLGLKSDGTVVATGDNSSGQCNVTGFRPVGTMGGTDTAVGLRAVADSGFSAWSSLVASTAALPQGGTVKFGVRLSGDGLSWTPVLGRDGNPIDWTTGSGNYLGVVSGQVARTDLSALPKSRYIDVVVRMEAGSGDVELKGVSVTYDRDDATAPTVADDAPTVWRNADTTVTVAATDTLSGVASLDVVASPDAPVTRLTTGTALVGVSAEGTTTIAYSAIDDAGNRCATQTATVRIDKSAPGVAIIGGLGSASIDASDAVSGIASVFYTVDSGAPQAYLGGSFNPGASGTHLITAWATDVAGNIAAKSALVTVDTQAPTAFDDAPSSWQSGDTTVTIIAHDTESAIAGIDWAFGGASSGTGSSAGSPAGALVTAEGTTTVDYSAADTAGNRCATQTATVRIDRTPPVSAAGYASGWQHGPVTVMLNAADALSGVASIWYRTNPSAAWTLYTGPFLVAEEGASSVQFRAYDVAGNAEDPQTALVQIDNTAPTCADDVPAGWINHPWQLQWSATDALSGVTGMDADYSGAYVWHSLHVTWPGASNYISQEGTTTLVFTATDAAGNVSSPRTATLRIDSTDPFTTASHTAGWSATPVTVALNAADAYSGVAATYYRLGSSPATMTYTGPFTIGAAGSTTVTYWSADAAGNVEAPQTTTVQVDDRTPDVSDDAPSGWQTSAVDVHLHAGATPSGIASIDDTVTAPSTTTTASTAAADATVHIAEEGTTTIEYSAASSAGNRSTAHTATVRIDSAVPSTTASHTSGWSATPVTVSLDASDAVSGVTATWYRIGTGGKTLYEGPFEIDAAGETVVTFWSVDAAGNTETAKTTTVRIDAGGPTVTDDASAAWQRGPVDVWLHATDPGAGVGSLDWVTADASGTATSGSAGSGDATFSVSAEGANTIEYSAADTLGNRCATQTATVRIDNSAPVTTDDHAAAYVGGAQISLVASDALSGVAGTDWALDGAAGTGSLVATSAVGNHTLQYASTDVAGNREATRSVTFEVKALSTPAIPSTLVGPNLWSKARAKKTIRFGGQIRPAHATAVVVEIQLLVHKKYRGYKTFAVYTNNAGVFTFKIKLKKGTYRLRASAPPRKSYAAARLTKWRVVKVR